MKLVPLTRGAFALIDDEDWPIVRQHTWFLTGSSKSERLYAATKIDGANVPMHRVLLGTGADQLVDHVSGISLDNRRANLRRCSHKENMRNTGPRPRRIFTGCRFKGVSENKKNGRRCVPNGYRAKITVDGRQIWIGAFRTPEDAARAYDVAAKKYFGAFAFLNFPDDGVAA